MYKTLISRLSTAALMLLGAYAHADIVAGVSIKDFSSQLDSGYGFNRDAAHTINGSGLSAGQHSNIPDGTMWATHGTSGFYPPNDPLPAFITFDLGQNYSLTGVHVWNYNEAGFTSRSAGAVQILVSSTTNVADLVRLDNAGSDFGFAPGSGLSNYPGFDVDFSNLTNATLLQNVRLVQLNILSNYGDQNQVVGLSEVQFFGAVPESSLVAALPLCGLAAIGAWRRRGRSQAIVAGI